MNPGRAIRGAACTALLVVCVPLPATAGASSQDPTEQEVSRMVMCPTCDTTLDRSEGPSADRMRALVRRYIEQGKTRQQVLDSLVREYGGDQGILATPPVRGRGLVAWLVPPLAFLALAAGAIVTIRGWRWRRGSDGSAGT